MRHRDKIKKFGMERKLRSALLRSLAVSLLRDQRIKTTEAKAKALRPFVERLIALALRGNPSTRRLLYSRIGNVSAVKLLCAKIAPRFSSRSGGYSRVVKAGIRRSDGARMAIIQLVD